MTLDRQLSRRIQIGRLICIFFMIYIHVPPYETNFLGINDNVALTAIKSWIISLGYASAPLLSTLSGILAYRSISKRQNYKIFVTRRFGALIVPMLFWAVLTVAVAIFVEIVLRPTWFSEGMDKANYPTLYVLNVLTFLFEVDLSAQTAHLAFLRDLFLCAVLSPFIIYFLKRIPALFIIFLVIIYLFDLRNPITLRPLIYLAYTIGIFISMKNLNLYWFDKYRVHLGWVFIIISVMYVGVDYAQQKSLFQFNKELYLLPILRTVSAIFLWTITALVLSSHALSDFIRKHGTVTFLAFCMHALLLSLVYFAVWTPLFGTGALPDFVFFVTAPLLSFLVAKIADFILSKYLPGIYSLASGSRKQVIE